MSLRLPASPIGGEAKQVDGASRPLAGFFSFSFSGRTTGRGAGTSTRRSGARRPTPLKPCPSMFWGHREVDQGLKLQSKRAALARHRRRSGRGALPDNDVREGRRGVLHFPGRRPRSFYAVFY